MPAALAPWVGPNAAGLSPASIVRLVAGWQDEYPAWSKRDLRQEEIVCRRPDTRPCRLVVNDARKDGRKALLAISAVERESEL